MSKALIDKALLGVILLAIFVVPSSISGTALALPAIGSDLSAPLTGLNGWSTPSTSPSPASP